MFCFKPKQDEFFQLFADSARFLRKGAYLLKEVLDDQEGFEQIKDQKLEQMAKLEHDADEINDEIIDRLNRTFITPLDREDIYALATMLDDVVDFLQGTMERMVLYRTGRTTSGAAELGKILAESTDELVTAIDWLKNINGNQNKILDGTRKISAFESEGDRIYRREVALLFTNCPDPVEIIKWKEILEHLEDALDHCEKIADLLRGVVMKYA